MFVTLVASIPKGGAQLRLPPAQTLDVFCRMRSPGVVVQERHCSMRNLQACPKTKDKGCRQGHCDEQAQCLPPFASEFHSIV